MRRRIAHVAQHGEFAVHFGGHRSPFVAQSDVYGEMRMQPPVILDVASGQSLPETARRQRLRISYVQGDGLIGEKARQRSEDKLTVRVAQRQDVAAHPLDGEAELQRV